VAVYATMYVRDHARPAFHKALGIDPTEYDYTVFRICSDITKQVFPVVLDSDNPKFRARMDTILAASRKMQGANLLVRTWQRGRIGIALAGLYFMPTVKNALPVNTRMVPAW
jgi:magnesium-protoporphyrin IX monomethyl ester (oxidative) cyclase